MKPAVIAPVLTALILWTASILWTPPAFGAAPAIQPPCGTAAVPHYEKPGAPPAIAVMDRGQLKTWRTAGCTGWPAAFRPKLVIALAGSFRSDGSLPDILARIGSVSAMRNVQYWSRTERTWRPLILDASALSGADPKARRADFRESELTPGAEHRYWVRDSRFGPVTYARQVLVRSQQRVVIATWNETPIAFLMLTLFKPQGLRSVEVIEKLSPGVWGVYILLGADGGLGGGEASYINRVVAVFRYIAGIRTDLEPPAAR